MPPTIRRSGQRQAAAEVADRLERDRLNLLRLLGDPAAQIAYDRNVPIAQVPAELFCMWFDDFYHPDSEHFQDAFSIDECAILAAFHERYRKIRGSLPRYLGRVADLHSHAAWHALMSAAVDTLWSLGEDPRPGSRGLHR